MRRGALVILLIALLAGVVVRSYALGARELSPDEAASWAAARASSLAEVGSLQAQLNPGKLAVYELAEHFWIGIFGDGLGAMRSLSVLFGSIAVWLTFVAALELLSFDADTQADRELVAAVAALICAISLITIKYSREARVYPLMLAANLAQVAFYVRAVRSGRAVPLIGTAAFTAFAISTNFASALTLVPEGLWLLRESFASSLPSESKARSAWTAVALALGAACLAPALAGAHQSLSGALARGTYEWIQPVPLWEPWSLFSRGSGTFPFPVLFLLAAWGVYRGWRRCGEATRFALLWMWAPPLALLLASRVFRPLFVERLLLPSFVPFFILVALGICELRDVRLKLAACVLVVALCLGHVVSWNSKPHDAQWREATEAAANSSGAPITAMPRYAIEVVRYYLPDSERDRAQGYDEHAPQPVLILGDGGLAPDVLDQMAARYPHVIRSLRGVTVRAR